jgi:hypothetical protein
VHLAQVVERQAEKVAGRAARGEVAAPGTADHGGAQAGGLGSGNDLCRVRHGDQIACLILAEEQDVGMAGRGGVQFDAAVRGKGDVRRRPDQAEAIKALF